MEVGELEGLETKKPQLGSKFNQQFDSYYSLMTQLALIEARKLACRLC